MYANASIRNLLYQVKYFCKRKSVSEFANGLLPASLYLLKRDVLYYDCLCATYLLMSCQTNKITKFMFRHTDRQKIYDQIIDKVTEKVPYLWINRQTEKNYLLY